MSNRQGWGCPMNSKKYHYFIIQDGARFELSLCGKWAYGGDLYNTQHEHEENCKVCKKERLKLLGVTDD